MDSFHLLVVAGQKTGAALEPSRCCQVGMGAQVFAFRVIPGMRAWMSIVNGYADLPVHLSIITTGTVAPNHDELTLIVGDCTGSHSTTFKVELLCPTCI